ncbi:Vps54-domain-containing protein [Hesseltinella vesiculosa]|uniref:Vacuolar protein sorting-associated protein 54 n=1 Tax=Hesseltinella vesiculosa TaxID=101127 RepID=A0A1X2GDT0_9FUNG|nr:Vps54-domain-containing protein [Hesseltinella vesiculosa]
MSSDGDSRSSPNSSKISVNNGAMLSSLASPPLSHGPSPSFGQQTSPLLMNTHLMSRERSYPRDDLITSTSRPPSVRSASSHGRHRLLHGQHNRRPSSYSNFSTMSETSLPWTTKDIGFHAISGVLNDPAKRTTASGKSADIAPVPQASISNVRRTDFDAYLQHIVPVFERYQYNKLTNQEDGSTIFGLNTQQPALTTSTSTPTTTTTTPSLTPGSIYNAKSSRNPYSLPQQVMSTDSLLSVESAPSPQRDLPMLENVPSVFFDELFHLENPRTFDAVTESADVVGNSGPNPPLSTNHILQEKLSYYLDTVEIHLLQEIENRSPSFFEALSNLQALHQQTRQCVDQIHALRAKMQRLAAVEARPGLEVIRLHVRHRNLVLLHDALTTIKDLVSAQPMIQILLGQGDYFGALDLIRETRAVLHHQQDSSNDDEKSLKIDWRSVKALMHLSTQLDEMEKAVAAMMQHDFVSILMVGTDQDPTALKDRLASSVMGLLSTQALDASLQDYKDQSCLEIKDMIRKSIPGTSQDEDSEEPMAKSLISMPFGQFFSLLDGLLDTLLHRLDRASLYDRQLTELIDECSSHQSSPLASHSLQNGTFDAEDQIHLSKATSNQVASTMAEVAHVRLGKILASRHESHTVLNPTDFYRLCHRLQSFIHDSEASCGRTCFGLRGTFLSQQKAFVDHFHMERLKQESQLIDNEQWVACEVPGDFQQMVVQLCQGYQGSDADGPLPDEAAPATKLLVISDQPFYVVGCTLLIIKLLDDYFRCVQQLEPMATEVMQRLFELLKLFNSRVNQVILGAGAMRSAGLKNISAKHLALASQSIGVMIALTPVLKTCMSKYVPEKHGVLLSEFDRVANDYQNHQREIHLKLVAIMNERFAVHIRAMKAVRWDTDDLSGKHANIYMETLVKETMTLHKVLNKYLPSLDLQFIMVQVFQSFTHQLAHIISELTILTEAGKARLIQDASYFTRRLSSLQGVTPPTQEVLEAAQAITLPPPNVPSNP